MWCAVTGPTWPPIGSEPPPPTTLLYLAANQRGHSSISVEECQKPLSQMSKVSAQQENKFKTNIQNASWCLELLVSNFPGKTPYSWEMLCFLK